MNSPLRLLPTVLAVITALFFHQHASAEEMVVGNIRVLKVEGSSVEFVNAAGQKSTLRQGGFIQQGAKITTGPDSTVELVFDNGTLINIAPSSTFSVEEFVTDPFNADNLDYKKVDQAPTRSVTTIEVPEGSIIFDVAKLKSGSTFDIVTPLGIAGIRGTSGFAGPAAFGLVSGSAVFSYPGSQSAPSPISAGSQFSSGSPVGNMTPVPPSVMASVSGSTGAMRSSTPPNTFGAAPPKVTPQQAMALQAAAAGGGEALAQTAAELSISSPEAAADIAAAASYLAPDSASTIAARVATAVPGAAVSVARSVSKMVPAAQAAIADAVSSVAPPASADAVQQASAEGAAEGNAAQQGQPTTAPQPVNTGDQGATDQGQSLPPATSSSTGSGTSGNPARPTPASQ
jgi:hypothetical protein